MGELRGPYYSASQLAAMCAARGWKGDDLIYMVATILSESQGGAGSFNDNVDEATGRVKSRDVGLCQINIPGRFIGTVVEKKLYKPANNLRAARLLYKVRRFQPWYGFTFGWATYPEDWYFSRKGKGWLPSGQYLHRAIEGVANYQAGKLGIHRLPAVRLWERSAKPTKPPAAGEGWPKPNNGRP